MKNASEDTYPRNKPPCLVENKRVIPIAVQRRHVPKQEINLVPRPFLYWEGRAKRARWKRSNRESEKIVGLGGSDSIRGRQTT